MAILEEKVLERATLFEGAIFNVTRDRVALPDGSEGIRDVLRHKGAVCVLPLTDEGEVLLVRQFRHGFGGVTLEIPAGKLESSDTNPKSAVLRELGEETGAVPGRVLDLGVFYGSPAIVDEKIYMYLALDLTFGDVSPDADEFIEIERVPLSTAVEWVLAGAIPDGKTQAAILRAHLMRTRGEI